MFDVFYLGSKPNLFAFEKPAHDLDDAARQSKTKYYWFIYSDYDHSQIDFDFVPVPWQSQYIHVWPSQWHQFGGVYLANKNTVKNREWHFHNNAINSRPNKKLFQVLADCEFDYSWRPHPHDPTYKYVFGNQWWPGEIMPTVIYTVDNAQEEKYMREPYARLTPHNNWSILIDCEFDRSWVPDPGDPPFIYVFGNQWYPAEVMPTVEYHVPGATERKYVDYMTPRLLANKNNWEIDEHIDSNIIDYSWIPHPNDPPYIHHFADEYSLSAGVIYRVPNATTDKFEGQIPLIHNDISVSKTLEIFFIDKSNEKSQVRFDILSTKYIVTKVRYVNSMFETIQRCVNRAKGTKFWIISSDYNYEGFDFNWHPEHWQQFMTHVFPSQHNKWSDTFLINKYEFERHAKWATSLEQFPNLNFVTDQTVEKPESTADIYYVDHANPESDDNYNYLKVAAGEVIRTRFVGEYLDVLKRIANNAETEYVWVISSLCKYNYFDFTWEPEPWQREMIHCFRSEAEKRGDTFYIHVESFKKQMVELELLDWFNVINYVKDSFVERYPMPVHVYSGDDLVTEIKNYDFKTPYVTFTNQPGLKLLLNNCLWSEKDRTVVRATRSGATCIVPRDIKQHLKTQIYDYPYLNKVYYVSEYYNDKSHPGIDIVYISNGEPDEEKWYDTLCYVSNSTGSEIKWIRGVNGRTAAYQAAARASTTPWFFAVFAKIEVDVHFPWREWMPDYWQEPKHYIFNARNPVNGLEYGHQGVIAYNKRLVLENNDPGIDFTLSQPHESVPIFSGTAHFNQEPWMTWRTAFREVIKLKHFDATAPTLENSHRLDVWCTQAKGKYSDYCLAGARDAVAYYEEVNGDYEKLKLSFEWDWLRTRFEVVKLRYGI